MLHLLFSTVVVAGWVALYFAFLRPKLESFRSTAGIYARIQNAETDFRTRLGLRLDGAKVAIVGVITSVAPIAAPYLAQAYGLNWSQFFPPDKAEVYGFVFSLLGIVGPMIMAALHGAALDQAAKIEPVKE